MKTLKLFATLRDLAGAREIHVPFREGQTVRELIEGIRGVSPALADKVLNEQGELSGLVHILVHGRNAEWLQGLDTPIKESDQVTLLPPSAGG